MGFLGAFIMGAATFICFYLVYALFKWLFGKKDDEEDDGDEDDE